MEEQTIVLCDEEGNEVLGEIVLTLESEGKEYVFVAISDEEAEEVIVEVYRYEETDANEGKLYEIDPDDKETWQMIHEVFTSFENEQME